MASDSEILLTQQQHSDLSSIAQSRALPAGYVFRAKLILMLAEAASSNAIKRQPQTPPPTILPSHQRAQERAECMHFNGPTPTHASGLSLHEAPALQALRRRFPLQPFPPGRAEDHGLEYDRHGTLSLYAALNPATGRARQNRCSPY